MTSVADLKHWGDLGSRVGFELRARCWQKVPTEEMAKAGLGLRCSEKDRELCPDVLGKGKPGPPPL